MTKDMMDVLFDLIRDLKEDNDEIKTILNDMRVVQAEQAIILEEHQKVSRTNHKRLSHVENELIPMIVNKLAPTPINWKKTISWFMGILVSLSTILVTLWKMGLLF